MPERTRRPLTAKAIEAFGPKKRLYRVVDGRGMSLEVQPNGGKYWRFRYRHLGKQKMISLGVYPDVGLAEARKRREEARMLVASGTDPSAKRQQDKRDAMEAGERTFEAIARDYLAKQGAWSDATLKKQTSILETHVLPWIGKRPISDIEPDEYGRILDRLMEAGKLETAHRANQISARIFKSAMKRRLAIQNPAAAFRGEISTRKARHHASITNPKDVGALMRAIESFQGTFIVQCALRLSSLLFVRPGELRRAEWSEIDLTAAVWRIAAHKMKMRKEHIVPLSKQAVTILHELHPLTRAGKYVFPGARSASRPMSENTIIAALRRLGYSGEEMTAHGFRSTASTLLHELGYDPHVIERQLAHVEQDQVKDAYNRAQYLTERKKMMQAWADYLDNLREGRNVVALREAG